MRPILVGMNNPLSSDPAMALFPWPQGSAGYRLWRMLHDIDPEEFPRSRYLRAFERINICNSQEWSPAEARAAAPALVERLRAPGQQSIIFGTEVWSILRLGARPVAGEAQALGDGAVTHFCFHPSGRSLWYNDPGNRMVLGALLAKMLRESASAGG